MAAITRREVNTALIAGAVALAVPVGVRPARAVAVPLFDFAIAGGGFHGLWQVRGELLPGEALRLRPEPGNPFDANAVAVERADGLMLGYIPRVANEPIVRLLAEGARVEAEVVGPVDFWNDEAIDRLVCTDVGEGDPVVSLRVSWES